MMYFANVKELPTNKLTGLAPTPNLISAHGVMTFAVNAIRVRLDNARVTIVRERQKLAITNSRGNCHRGLNAG